MTEYLQMIRDGLDMCMSRSCMKCPIFQIVGMDYCPFDSLRMDEWEDIAKKIQEWKQNNAEK